MASSKKQLRFSEPFIPLGSKKSVQRKTDKEPSFYSPPATPSQRVLDEYLRLSGGYDQEVRLANLRSHLPDLSQDEVDTVLRQLRIQGKLVPYPIENARELKPEDEAAALTLGITNHHYIRVKE